MTFVLEAFFDPATEATIHGLWQELVQADIGAHRPNPGSRPHLSLVGCTQLDVQLLIPALERLAGQTMPFAITFAHLGYFLTSEGVLFLVPIVTHTLLQLHQHLWQLPSNKVWLYPRIACQSNGRRIAPLPWVSCPAMWGQQSRGCNVSPFRSKARSKRWAYCGSPRANRLSPCPSPGQNRQEHDDDQFTNL